MARVFVLTGGSRSQLGLLENARAVGCEVCVDGSESAPLLAEADHRIVRSFTEVERVLGDLEAQGIEAAAVYADCDRGARHVRLADQAVHIGGNAPGESYLRIDRIVLGKAPGRSGGPGPLCHAGRRLTSRPDLV
mgnify:CR=1 FL=1